MNKKVRLQARRFGGALFIFPADGQQLGGVRFVSEPLPRTATGKIKRWELQQKG